MGSSLVLFTNARVFDGERAECPEHLSVLVEGERIKEISETAIHCEGAQVIDLRGRTLMPGLIDAHVHVYGSEIEDRLLETRNMAYNALYARQMLEHALRCGFTTVRDVGGGDLAIASAISNGLIEGPRFLYAGRMLSMTGGHADPRPAHYTHDMCSCGLLNHFYHVVDGEDACRRAAREELRRGAHCVKFTASGGVMSPTDPIWMEQFTAEEISAIVEECARRRTYAAAHCYGAAGALRCAELGVRTIEHGTLIDRPVAQRIAEIGAFVTPTLSIIKALIESGAALGLTPVSQAKAREVYTYGLSALSDMKMAGVKVAFGTDLVGNLYKQQTREFLLRRDVLQPIDILRSATSVSADAMMLGSQIGKVAVGMIADLIVVEGDPLKNIELLAEDGRKLPVIMSAGRLRKVSL
jgi:imidazolonepropionase-like amidohydrolase